MDIKQFYENIQKEDEEKGLTTYIDINHTFIPNEVSDLLADIEKIILLHPPIEDADTRAVRVHTGNKEPTIVRPMPPHHFKRIFTMVYGKMVPNPEKPPYKKFTIIFEKSYTQEELREK